MGKKRKHAEVEAVPEKKDNVAPERPPRTLFGWKNKPTQDNNDQQTFRNKEKVLVTCSRRINYRYRHLMLNLVSILPHCKKDNKVESKATKGATLNELVELKNCSSCLFFECRKHKDLYLWMSKCPNGPSVKFLVNAVHTMEELKLTGNHLKGARPLLTFSSNFDKDPHWKLLKEMITQSYYEDAFVMEKLSLLKEEGEEYDIMQQSYYEDAFGLVVGLKVMVALDEYPEVSWLEVRYLECSRSIGYEIFGTPKEHRKSKPYYDHVFVFSIVDDHIWFRNYQISCPHTGDDKIDRGGLDKMTLIEVGPRFCLNPIKIFGGSFGGPTLYENPFYVSPNQIRSLEKRKKAGKYANKVKAKTKRNMHAMENQLVSDEIEGLWKA
ncbi:hypothetical protein Tco_0810351 [Tanacetum coccineum]